MKKSALKLTVCRETLRMLAGMELARVSGGSPGTVALDSAGAPNGCVNVAAADSAGGGGGCPLPAKP